MSVFTFTIRSRERGQLIGQAVICVKARYASVLWTRSPHADRRFATIAQWQALQLELDDKLPAAPLEDQSTVVQLLAGDRAGRVSIQYLSQEPLPADVAPSAVIVELDQRLRQVQEVR